MHYIGWLGLFLILGTSMGWQYERQSGVKNLDAHSYDKIVNKPNRITYIHFYKASDKKTKKKFKKIWSETAQALKGVATIAAVDCETNEELCENLSIENLPTLLVRQGDEEFQTYSGKQNKKSFMADAKKRIPTEVQVLKKKKMKKFLKKNKNIPKALVFVKNAGSLVIKSLAMQLSGRMVFAEILKKERKLIRKYDVEKFPTLLVISATTEKGEESGTTFYSGRFTGASLLPWLNARALPGESDDETLELVEQLTDDSCMEALCLQGGLCAVLIISQDPSSPDIKLLKEYLPLISQLEDDQIDSLYHFAWLEGISQMEFLQKAFGMEPRDYPQLVVFNAKRLIYAPFVGSFSFSGIKGFLQGLKGGQVKTKPMGVKTLPSLAGDSTRCAGMKSPPTKEAPSKKKKVDKTRTSRGHRGGKGPVELTEENWEEKLVSSASNWMVVFIDKEDPNFTKEWKKASLTLKNMVRFGIVDCSEVNGDLADTYSIDTFPAVIVFRAGLKKDEYTADDYDGDLTTEELSKYALDLLEDSNDFVRRIAQEDMDDFFKKDPVQPRLVLFSEKSSTPNLFKSVALEYGDTLIFAISSDEALAESFGVHVFPTIVVLNGHLGEVVGGKAELKVSRHLIPKKKLNVNGLTQLCDNLSDQWISIKRQQEEKSSDQETFHDEL